MEAKVPVTKIKESPGRKEVIIEAASRNITKKAVYMYMLQID